MSDPYGQAIPRADMAVDAGLRKFMLGVYNKMGLGLLWSAFLAYAVGAYAPLTQLVLGPPVLYVVMWGPPVLLLASNFLMRNPSPTGSAVLYWTVVTLIGASLGVWVAAALGGLNIRSIGGTYAYNVTFAGIGQAFLMTAIAFGGLSVWGYTTKRDLSPIGSFLIFATFGIVAIATLNFFWFKSDMLMIGMQLVSLFIFGLLIAFQTQALKYQYYAFQGDGRSLAVATTEGALNLYIAFITIFQVLLSFFSRE